MDATDTDLETRPRGLSASYDPCDNKLRLRSAYGRLDSETYAKVKAAGFSWAPKQDLFVAPAWSPEREDLMLELCGEIGDEDTSLADRAEQRADRFEGYSEHRAEDAHAAHKAVEAVSERFAGGQPLLIGHHSYKRALKDKERIENGMRKAIRMWDTASYWTRRAAGAIAAAKYKELPAVRHRRIKGLEAEMRRQVKSREHAMGFVKLFQADILTPAGARAIFNVGGGGVQAWYKLDRAIVEEAPGLNELVAELVAEAIVIQTHTIERCERWISHLTNRLAYERAMLDEGGGIPAQKFDLAVGGRVLIGRGWAVVTRVNRKDGQVVSVSIAGRFYGGAVGIESIQDYRAPEPGDAEKVAKATKLAPIVNYPGEGLLECTSEEWKRWMRSQSGTLLKAKATETHGAFRYRSVYRGAQYKDVYVTDMKRVDRPVLAQVASEPAVELPDVPLPEPRAPRAYVAPEPTVFDAMKETLKAGIKVVSAPQLFPTPPELARRMVEVARILPGHDVLEPSAGTGNLVRAVGNANHGGRTVLVEHATALCEPLRREFPEAWLLNRDFLDLDDSIGRFDIVAMNPPFAAGADVAHILHAIRFLKPTGRLVALCANGPRQNEKLRPVIERIGGTWEALPEGSFASEGTGVRVALLTVSATP
jgi:hypothetical protein